ncbi:hypothetical protein SAMN05444695_10127 [Rhodococcus triatomae]|uniref:EcsC protein family protein n=1 Tax=Rhodococcus triatomae TaxID=300028 RepID=A0A1G7Z7T2_9NOCA|nr:hypothetical protein [Rhodococcus triatomae]SDH04659.1 hypothetical protein SAMN05444695_10127 [Rhodococcus triatomae]
MGTTVATGADSEDGGRVERTLVSVLDNGARLQGPAVERYVAWLRRAHPDESPAQIVTRMEKMFLTTVTGSGGAVGATAAVPGIGTVAAIAAVGAESVFFLEASALLTLAVASVHGVPVTDHQQRRALVLSVALGDAGMEIVRRATGVRGPHWVNALNGKVPAPVMRSMNNTLVRKWIAKYAAKRSALVLGKLIPAGIGAAIGGVGNRAIGRRVIDNARTAFGPAPSAWPHSPRALPGPGGGSAPGTPPSTL